MCAEVMDGCFVCELFKFVEWGVEEFFPSVFIEFCV
jgi:hypothetical protein